MARDKIQCLYHKLVMFLTWLKYRNKFDLGKDVEIINLRCVGNSNKNCVKIGKGTSLINCTFVFNSSDKNKITIGENCTLLSTEFILRNGSIVLGNGCTTGRNFRFAACEGKTITVGNDCQFSDAIQLWTTDFHPIYNLKHVRINDAKDINIGHHVWIGSGALILKGASINDGCIVGARSVVTGFCKEKNGIYVGVPARLVKNSVKWERKIEKTEHLHTLFNIPMQREY